jgi:hypothetical protein
LKWSSENILVATALYEGELKFLVIGKRDHQTAIVGEYSSLFEGGDRPAAMGKQAVEEVEEFSFQIFLGVAFCFHGIVSPVKNFIWLFAENMFRQTSDQKTHDHLGGGVRRLGDRGCLSLFGDKPDFHRLAAGTKLYSYASVHGVWN